MSEYDIFRKKAELLIAGTIVLGAGVSLPFPLSRSSAGPEVGTRNLLLGFGGTRVKLKVSRDPDASPFILSTKPSVSASSVFSNHSISSTSSITAPPVPNSTSPTSRFVSTDSHPSAPPTPSTPDNTSTPSIRENDPTPGDRYVILKGDSIFLDPVHPIRTPIHAPDQAFINIDARCRYDCLFCTSRDLKNYRRPTNDEWIALIRRQAEAGTISSIAITSGIPASVEEHLDDFVTIIHGVVDLGLPIGVEPYVTRRDQLERLHEAGATELKLNIQSWDPSIYHRICPDSDLDLGDIEKLLKHGVDIFGLNRVQSNMIIGLGERDETILDGVRTLAGMGVAVSLRRLHVNDINRVRLDKVLDLVPITVQRYLDLRTEQEQIFAEKGIDPSLFRTMCFPCKGCDLEPWRSTGTESGTSGI